MDIEPTRDEDDIRKAYARRLKVFRPDVDPEGFQRLVGARDAALAWAEAWVARMPATNRQISEEKREDAADPTSRSRPKPGDASSDRSEIDHSVERSAASQLQDVQRESADRDDRLAVAEYEKHCNTTVDPTFGAVQPNEIPTQSELEELVLRRLDDIMQPARRGRMSADVDVWDVRTWNDLFNRAASLDLKSHKRFHDTIGRYFVNFLPDGRTRTFEGLRDFAAGHGVTAVIEAIEQECRFAEQPGKLVDLSGQDAAMTYLSWLADAQSGRDVINRRSAGKPAYVDQTTGIPIFPHDDRLAALGSEQLVAFHDLAIRQRRWPFRFDWLAMFVPAEKLVAAGWTRLGLVLLGVTVLLAAMGLKAATPAELIAVLVSIFFLLTARPVIAAYSTRLAVRASIKRVMDADKLFLWHRRDRLSVVVNRQQRTARIARIIEIAASLVVVVPFALHLWMSWQIRNDLDRPVEAVVSETVISAFEGVADNDSIPAGDLFDFLARVREAEAEGFAGRGNGTSVTVRDISDISWLVGLRSNRDRMLGKALLNPREDPRPREISATEAMERQRKLHAIADAYRTATPAERIQLEFGFYSWRQLLQAAKGPQATAAIWATIPPRGPNQDAFAEEMRKQLLGSLLSGAIDNNDRDETNQLIAKLHWLLTVPDGAFPYMKLTAQTEADLKAEEAIISINRGQGIFSFPLSIDPLQQALKTSGYTNSQISVDHFNSPAYFENVMGRDEPHFEESNLPWSDFVLTRRTYFQTAKACLDMSDEQSRLRIRQIIIHSLATLPRKFGATAADFWQNSTRALLAEPQCYRKFFASTANEMSRWKYSSNTDTLYENAARDLRKFVTTVPNADAAAAAKAFVDGVADKEQIGAYISYERDNLLETAHTLLGAEAYARRDYRGAILHFDLALSYQSVCNEARARRGQVLDAIGEHKRAIADYKAVFDKESGCNQDRLADLRRALGAY